ncbi:MAG: diacylglycerol kinase [Thermoguttaceae bacterium]|jgi:diacylglycerol kinase|nr:diacylglycerol kinase [Thermoguttaceae bacterium]
MNTPAPRFGWCAKFRNAFRGIGLGIRGESSFKVHFFFGAAVMAAGMVLRIDDLRQWCLLLLCIAIVLSAELFNSALERMARAISKRHDPNLGAALDIGSAAVLAASIGAATVGTIIFLARLGELLGWWG